MAWDDTKVEDDIILSSEYNAKVAYIKQIRSDVDGLPETHVSATTPTGAEVGDIWLKQEGTSAPYTYTFHIYNGTDWTLVEGDQGEQGEPGEGVAPGGTSGQFLIKNSATDYDTTWSTPDTDDIGEGTTNLYYTETRVNNNTNVSSNTSFRTTPSTVITAGTNISWSGNTLNVTDTNTTYSAGTGLSLSGTEFSTNDSQIDHNSLNNYSAGEHRTINDSGIGTTDLWSADKINTELGDKAETANAMGVVVHGATASTARPSGYNVVQWIGSVEPTNAVNDDIWVDTS